MESTAGLILRMRREAGLSQSELARRSDIGRTVISAYEHAAREPSASALARLAGACGYELKLAPRPQLDLDRNAQVFEQVLELAELLPRRRRERDLMFPPLADLPR